MACTAFPMFRAAIPRRAAVNDVHRVATYSAIETTAKQIRPRPRGAGHSTQLLRVPPPKPPLFTNAVPKLLSNDAQERHLSKQPLSLRPVPPDELARHWIAFMIAPIETEDADVLFIPQDLLDGPLRP